MFFNVHRRTTIAIILVVIVVGLIVFYHYFDPTYSLYAPKCLLKSLTGYDCPGCGCQRLLYHWANGCFCKGIRYNYFFLIAIIYIVFILIGGKVHVFQRFCTNRYVMGSFIALYIAWWIVRNILHI